MIPTSTINACIKAMYASGETTDHGKIQTVLRVYDAMNQDWKRAAEASDKIIDDLTEKLRVAATPPQPADGGDRVALVDADDWLAVMDGAAQFYSDAGNEMGQPFPVYEAERMNRARVAVAALADDMRAIAEGNLGGLPGQADYQRVKEYACAALAKFQPAGGEL